MSSPHQFGDQGDNPSDMINSYAFPPPASPHSRDSKLNTFYQQTFPSSKPTVDFSSNKILEANRSAGGFSDAGKALNRQGSYAISAENTIEHMRSLKDFDYGI